MRASTPLHDSLRSRLVAHGCDEEAARDAADAIVGGIVYAALTEGRAFPVGGPNPSPAP